MRATTLAVRAVYAVATACLAVTIAFVGMRLLPGSALRAQQVEAGVAASSDTLLAAAAELSTPVPVQLVHYFGGVLRGDLGASLYNARPVTVLIGERLPSTMALAGVSLSIATALVVVFSAASAQLKTRAAAHAVCVLGAAAPTFITSTLVIGVIGIPSPAEAANVIAAAAVLAFYVASSFAIPLMANIVHLQSHGFVTTARAKGLRAPRVFWVHIMPNALRPLLGLMAGQVGFLLTGTVVTEALFTRGGVGRLMLDSVLRRDYPVVQGLVLYAAVVYVTGQFIARMAAGHGRSEQDDA